MSPRKTTAYRTANGEVFETEKEASAAENKLSKAKFAAIKKRIASGRYWVPKVGEYVYTQTSMYLDHGEDDVCGGLSTVSRVYAGMSGGDAKCVFIEVAQHEHGGNWTQFLYPEQKRLMKEFNKNFSHTDPDYGPGGQQYDPHEWH